MSATARHSGALRKEVALQEIPTFHRVQTRVLDFGIAQTTRFSFQPLPFGVRFSRSQLISFDMGCDMRITEAEGKSRKRDLVWGGLAARCSACVWQRVYDPNARKHQLPTDELSETVRREFENHKCQDHQSAD